MKCEIWGLQRLKRWRIYHSEYLSKCLHLLFRFNGVCRNSPSFRWYHPVTPRGALFNSLTLFQSVSFNYCFIMNFSHTHNDDYSHKLHACAQIFWLQKDFIKSNLLHLSRTIRYCMLTMGTSTFLLLQILYQKHTLRPFVRNSRRFRPFQTQLVLLMPRGTDKDIFSDMGISRQHYVQLILHPLGLRFFLCAAFLVFFTHFSDVDV